MQEARLAALRAAHRSGALDLLIEKLAADMRRGEAPLPVDGPEWPLKRAFEDGKLHEAASLNSWLMGRLRESPDGAKNTEG
jgi:hypothetical protein